MNLPKIELKPGYDQAYRGGPIYTDLKAMLSDIRGGLQEYPTAELTVHDNPSQSRFGFQLYVIEGAQDRWWDFFISVQDFNKCVEARCIPEWVAMRTFQGRLAMVAQLRHEAGLT